MWSCFLPLCQAAPCSSIFPPKGRFLPHYNFRWNFGVYLQCHLWTLWVSLSALFPANDSFGSLGFQVQGQVISSWVHPLFLFSCLNRLLGISAVLVEWVSIESHVPQSTWCSPKKHPQQVWLTRTGFFSFFFFSAKSTLPPKLKALSPFWLYRFPLDNYPHGCISVPCRSSLIRWGENTARL